MRVKTTDNFLRRLKKDLKVNYLLYLLVLPGVAYYIIFCYVPMPGVMMAFVDYKSKLGLLGSPWVGLKHFQRFFNSYYFGVLIKNTLGISIYSLLVGFPIPIIFALMLNYLNIKWLKKTVQMVSYAPHFISTVVICGMLTMFLNQETGIVNQLLGKLGFETVGFLAEPKYFKSIYVWSDVWQGMGWSAIIYISVSYTHLVRMIASNFFMFFPPNVCPDTTKHPFIHERVLISITMHNPSIVNSYTANSAIRLIAQRRITVAGPYRIHT